MKWLITFSVLLAAGMPTAIAMNQYYVSSTGNDSNSGTSPGSPWATITHANAALAVGAGGVCTAGNGWLGVPNTGACVHVATGTYTASGLSTTVSGSTSAQVVYISDTQFGAKLIGGGTSIWDNTGANVVIAGFDISGNGTATTCVGPNVRGLNNQVLGNYIHDIPGGSCPFGGAGIATQSPAPAGLQAIGNILNNIGPAGPSAFIHGIYPAGINSIVENNLISNTAGYCIQFNHNVATEVIANNTVMNCRFGGIGMAGTSTVPFDHSSIINNIVVNTGNGTDCAIEERFGTSGTSNVYRNNLLAHNSCQFHFENPPETTTGNLCDTSATGCAVLLTAAQATNTNIFVNYTGNAKTGDYHLKAGSIALAAGVTGACAPSGLTPCVPVTTFDGTVRPSPPSIGAYDAASSGGGIPSASPTSFAFGNVLTDTDSATQVSTITNTGSASYSIVSTFINDTNFLSGGVGSCFNGQVIAPGASCTVSVKFHPLSTGAKSATITQTTSATSVVVSLSGTGTMPAVSLSPVSLAFGSQTLGTTSAIQTSTLTNTGTGALSISSIALGGTNPTQFTQTNTCGATVAAGASCTFSVTFKPTVLGAQSASITITDNASGSPHSIALTGTGIGTPNPQLSPTSLTFSNQPVGLPSASQPLTLTNNGTAPLTISSITPSGDFSQTNNCVSPIAVGASCTINITFTPTAPGTRSGSLVVSSNGPGSPNTASLTGTGIQGAISLAPTSLTFAALNVGSTSSGQTIAISNSGTATVTLNSVALSGTNAGDFGLTNGCGATLAAGGSCNVTITFSPSATGSRTASLTVTDDAPGSPHQAALSSTGTAPVASLAPSSIAFGNQITGSISSAQNLTLSNTGTGSLAISSIALTGANANQFTQTSTCGATLGPGASCTIATRFAPTSLGAKSASLTVTDSASGSPRSSTLSGTGIAGAPVASLSPASLTFPSTLIGVQSAGQTVTLQNTGTATLNISSIGITGDYSQTNVCGATLAVNASCAITVRFTPTAAGTRTGNLSVTDDASGSPQTVSLTGTGASSGGGGSGIAVFNPTSLAFPNQVTNTSSAAQVVTLTNTDTATMSISAINFGGGNPSDYSQTNNCVPSLGAGASCTVNVTFTPLATGPRPANLVFTDSASNSPQSVPLSGTGLSPFPIVQLTPVSLDFGSIQQGSTTASQTVQVKNIGTAVLNISSITKTGANAADYGLTNGCGSTLAVNATCTLTINFTPSGATTRVASISIADNAGNTPQTVPMTGVGTAAPAPKVSLSASSLTYSAQQVGTSSASQSVTVTNIGDATLNITSITPGPPNATDYTLNNGCGATLAPAASCTLGVVFNPVAAGTRVSTVTLVDNAADTPQSFSLTGTAFTGTPTADLSVSTLIFLSQVILTTSSAQTIALTNNGTAALLISSIVASSDSAPGSNEFVRTSNCAGTLPTGASCTVNVTFSPQAVGSRTGKVTFTDSAGSSPQVVSLMGTGTNPPPPPGNAATGIGGQAGIGGKSGIGVH